MILLPLNENTPMAPKRAGRSSPIRGSERLCGVLDQRNFVASAQTSTRRS